jgi:hypothetical protein
LLHSLEDSRVGVAGSGAKQQSIGRGVGYGNLG